MKKSKKKKLAIWIPGGIGGGYFSQGIPVISTIVDRLAVDYDITVYSFHTANADFIPTNFRFVSIHRFIKFSLLRWLCLITLFVVNHVKKKHEVLYAFWGLHSGFIAVLLGKFLGVKSIVHLQGADVVFLPEINYGLLRNKVNAKLAGWTYKNATELIALTYFQSNFLTSLGVKRQVKIIPYGVDLRHFPKKEWLYDGKREFRCLQVANYSPVKDQLTLLKAFAILSKSVNARLKIVGENSCNGALHKYCEQLSIERKVEFFETVPNSELIKFYSWTDVFILTSVYEGQGVVVAEAAASGNLLAGTSVGLLADLGDSCAIIVSPKDCDRLAESIEMVVKDRDRANRLVENSYRWAEQHDLNWTVHELVAAIESVQ